VNVGSNIQAIVATLDLQLVRLIRDAINSPGAGGKTLGASDPQIAPRKTIEPEPEFSPRQKVTPSPQILSGEVTYAPPKIIPLPPCYAAPVESETSVRTKSPIEPPWRLVPWSDKFPSAPAPLPVKPRPPRPDLAVRGRLIDAFC
jgi:hypothetical protein